ncbi:hypothetical protein ABH922_001435 [Rhodococcus sp. 27YEA15]|uniref:serine hydrolase n=1 Tax=Rhodococcus sp. 27YEA15 TaxID=3156259 RepID=UPI003C7C8868
MARRYVRFAVAAITTFCVAACSSGPNGAPDNVEQTPAFSAVLAPTPETLDERLAHAQEAALDRGAEISISVFDRNTDNYLGVGEGMQIETASVAKLFIAEDLFHQDARGERELTDDDRTLMTAMLESSDDTAANILWDAVGGTDVVTRVSERFALTSTTGPWDGMWWNTETTTRDLVTFYNGLLADLDQLGPERVDEFIFYLRNSTPDGTDGYDQRFGLPDALYAEPVLGVKQGWMCCISDKWIHLSTGVVGDDDRYVIAIASREDVQYEDDEDYWGVPDTSFTDVVDDESARHARDTVTGVAQILFPTGSVDDWSAQPTTTVTTAPGP